MCHPHRASYREQVSLLRRQFLQDGDLPFTDVLTEDVIEQALEAIGGWLDRIFSPLVTLWVFLGQVLGADHFCRAAVARLIPPPLARGRRPCSAPTRPPPRRPPERPPRGAGAAPLLRPDRPLRQGGATPAGVVLRRRGPFRR